MIQCDLEGRFCDGGCWLTDAARLIDLCCLRDDCGQALGKGWENDQVHAS